MDVLLRAAIWQNVEVLLGSAGWQSVDVLLGDAGWQSVEVLLGDAGWQSVEVLLGDAGWQSGHRTLGRCRLAERAQNTWEKGVEVEVCVDYKLGRGCKIHAVECTDMRLRKLLRYLVR